MGEGGGKKGRGNRCGCGDGGGSNVDDYCVGYVCVEGRR